MGFEPTISAGERRQTYALDRTATGACYIYDLTFENLVVIMYIQILKDQGI